MAPCDVYCNCSSHQSISECALYKRVSVYVHDLNLYIYILVKVGFMSVKKEGEKGELGVGWVGRWRLR